jgi:hypothetical protein
MTSLKSVPLRYGNDDLWLGWLRLRLEVHGGAGDEAQHDHHRAHDHHDPGHQALSAVAPIGFKVSKSDTYVHCAVAIASGAHRNPWRRT